MRRPKNLMRVVALLLLLSTVLATTPVSAAELTSVKPSLGAVSSVGSVQLRGMQLLQAGTVFSGDDLIVGANGFARVVFAGGHRLEMGTGTDVHITSSGNAVSVQVRSGNVSFTSAEAGKLQFVVGPYEVSPATKASGTVSAVSKTTMGVRSLGGDIAAHFTSSKESSTVTTGQERVFYSNGSSAAAVSQIATLLPVPSPTAGTPTPQGGRAGAPQANNRKMSKTALLAIFGTIGGSAAAIAYLATRGTNDVDIKVQIAKQKALLNAQAVDTTQAQQQTTTTQVTTTITTTQTAITNSNLTAAQKATFNAQATSLASAASISQGTLLKLVTRLDDLQAALNLPSNSSEAQIIAINEQILALKTEQNAEIANLDAIILSLNQLVSSAIASGVVTPNTQIPQVLIIPPLEVISAS